MQPTSVSVVIPALDEAAFVGPALDAIRAAFAVPATCPVVLTDLLVVDNGSRDATADIARAHAAKVVFEPVRGVARARNTGARAASGSVLLFLDADTIVPLSFGPALGECVADPHCVGGAFATEQRPRRVVIRAYLGLWRALGRVLGMAQGAAQFCRREPFESLGGYDESLHMGEDVDFYWRLKRLARGQAMRTKFVQHVRVSTSARRFDQWPLWKALLWTNPVFVGLLRRRARIWRAWYETPPR